MAHAFPIGDKLRGSFENFEAKCKRYYALSGEAGSDDTRIAIVQKNIADTELRKHLLRSADSLRTYDAICDEILSNFLAEKAATGPSPMDIGAISMALGRRGGRGYGRGNGKGSSAGEDLSDRARNKKCFNCEKAGHVT